MNTSRNIEELHPYFQPIVREVMQRARSRGLYPFIMEGKRSPEYQACLYARSRVSPGHSFEIEGYVVRTSVYDGTVIATCGSARYETSAQQWRRKVTNIFWSWHLLGFAADWSFRSSSTAKDHWIGDLERAEDWAKIEELYAAYHAIWLEVAPDVRWGNDWDQDGTRVKDDPDERLVDMPHWEWHPGRSMADVRGGKLPAFPRQCPRCRNFRPVFIGEVCRGCDDRVEVGTRQDAGWQPYHSKTERF